MKWLIYNIFCAFLLFSCFPLKQLTVDMRYGSRTKAAHKRSDFRGVNGRRVEKLLKVAQKYMGVPYKYGGETRSGIDCSGLIFVTFKEINVKLPRYSGHQAIVGKAIDVKKSRPGDLLFFATSDKKKISHAGIVHSVSMRGEIKFIHASSSKGVMISSLDQPYWRKALLLARRVL